MFKYEMHLHSSMTSKCASSGSAEYVFAAREKGYSGIVFTNHFFRGNSAIDKQLPWRDFTEQYRRDWLCAKEQGDKYGIDVLFGLEEGYGSGKECLIYGLSAEDIAECTDFPKMPIAEISAFVRSKGGFIACAHPFRARDYIKDPFAEPDWSLFDGVEVYNAANLKEANIMAEDFAKKHGLIGISGGDTHSVGGFGRAGVIFKRRAKTEKELVELLKENNFDLIRNKEADNF